jgi:hypothetical protein
MATLTKEEILGAADLPTETVEVPEWGGEVIVTLMTGEARDAFETSVYGLDGKQRDFTNATAKLVSATVVDEKGRRIFNTPQEVEALGRKSARALNRIATAARRLNAISREDLEEMEKN